MLFTVEREELCSCSNDKVEEIKKRMGVIDLVTNWWSRHLRAVNDVEDSRIEDYVNIMRSDLSERLGSNEFSEKSPVCLHVAEGGCGSLNGALAVYAGVADVDIVLPEGFEPEGLAMKITPHAVMIIKPIWHDETDERVEGFDTAVTEFLSCEEPNPVIPAVALWLLDTVVEYVEYDDPDATDDNCDERKGDLDKLYEQVATRLRNVDFKVTNAVEWGSDDLIKILRAAGSPIPAPRNITVRIEPNRVSAYTPGGVEFVIFEAKKSDDDNAASNEA